MDIFWTSNLNQQSFDQAVLASKSDDQKWLYGEVFKSAENSCKNFPKENSAEYKVNSVEYMKRDASSPISY